VANESADGCVDLIPRTVWVVDCSGADQTLYHLLIAPKSCFLQRSPTTRRACVDVRSARKQGFNYISMFVQHCNHQRRPAASGGIVYARPGREQGANGLPVSSSGSLIQGIIADRARLPRINVCPSLQ